MRFKNRYYLIELMWESTLSSQSSSSSSHALPSRFIDSSLQSHQLQSGLREAMLAHFGEFGLARVLQSLQVRYLNSLTNLAIVRVARADNRTLAAVLGFFNSLKQKQVILRTLHLSGTIRRCQSKAIQIQKERLQQLKRAMDTTPDATQSSQEVALSGVLKSANATANVIVKTPQQTLNQLASILSQYNAAKAQQTAAATSHSAAMALKEQSSSSLKSAEQTVAPTAASISAALDQIQRKGEQEINAIDV